MMLTIYNNRLSARTTTLIIFVLIIVLIAILQFNWVKETKTSKLFQHDWYQQHQQQQQQQQQPGVTADTIEDDELTKIYKGYSEPEGFHHWLDYGRAYTENIIQLRNSDRMINVLEIGVQSGGSSRVWKQYFGKHLKYTGVDINPNCKQFERESDNIHIEIGSQLDTVFLKDICLRFGPFDFIIDDGGHTTKMIVTTLNILWYCMKDKGVYAVEDLHTMRLWRNGKKVMLVDGKDFYGHLADLSSKTISYFDKDSYGNYSEPNVFSKHIQKVAIYDSIAFLHYRQNWKPITIINKGQKYIDYNTKVGLTSYV